MRTSTTPSPATSDRVFPRRRRGLTVLEIILAIALLLAIFALSLPAIGGLIRRRAFDAALDQVTSQLLLTRAWAREHGDALIVSYVPDPPRIEVRTLDLDAEEGGTVAADGESIAGTGALIAASFSVRPLPERIECATARPDWMLDAFQAELGAPDVDDDPLRASAESILITYYLPDGSAVPGDELWIHDGEAQAATLTLDAFTGLPHITLVPWDPDAIESPDDNEPDDEEPLPADDDDALPTRESPRTSERRESQQSRLATPAGRRPARRGAVLLETLISLALFVAASAFTLGALRSVRTSMIRGREEAVARDIAHSKLAELEAGIVQLADLRDASGALDAIGSVEFYDETMLGQEWELELETRRSDYSGLIRVTIMVRDADSFGSDDAPLASVEALLPISEDDEGFYEEDDLLEGLPDEEAAP